MQNMTIQMKGLQKFYKQHYVLKGVNFDMKKGRKSLICLKQCDSVSVEQGSKMDSM